MDFTMLIIVKLKHRQNDDFNGNRFRGGAHRLIGSIHVYFEPLPTPRHASTHKIPTHLRVDPVITEDWMHPNDTEERLRQFAAMRTAAE